jgi:hypothetical protein
MFEDKNGNLLMPDEVDALSPREIEDREIHIFEKYDQWFS